MTSGDIAMDQTPSGWACSGCNSVNSETRDTCKSCLTVKPSTGYVTVEQPTNLQKRKHDDVTGADRESTWKCDECQYRNFASASECFQCKTSQESQLKRKKENPNSWMCYSCRNNNWPHRTVCNRCKAPRPGLEAQAQNGFADWTCLNCDNINRAFREECNKCRLPKNEAINPAVGQFRTNQDWLCMSCGNSNYPYRIACNKCKLPKSEAMSVARSFDSQEMSENWLCYNCDNVNLPFRSECNKCKIEKKEGINPETAYKRTNLDWKCTVCDNVNFYYRVFCNKCQLPKSEIGEEMKPPEPAEDHVLSSLSAAVHAVGAALGQPVPAAPGTTEPGSGASAVAPSANSSLAPGPLTIPVGAGAVDNKPTYQTSYTSYSKPPTKDHPPGTGESIDAVQMFRQQQQPVGNKPRSHFTVDYERVQNRTDNWTCFNCDNLNFPLRTQCNKCKMSKAEALSPETRSGRIANGDAQWRCGSCGNNNYHFRLECNKCGSGRPPRTGTGGTGGFVSDSYGYGFDGSFNAASGGNEYYNSAGGGGGNSYQNFHPAIQQYSNNKPPGNFPNNSSYSFYGPGGPTSGGTGGGGGFSAQNNVAGSFCSAQQPVVQPGEPTCSWICAGCENVNWPKRSRCNKCGKDKSSQTPNWVCGRCSHINHSFATECNSCKAYKDS
eukprot:sb/3462774/